jgi:aminoglycoside 6'-N-acetyltransferase
MTNIIFENNKLIVRRIEQSDAELITRWLSDPEVLQYYEGRDYPQDLELVKKHYIDMDDNETRCIVQYDHVEIGYIQYYPVDEDGKKEYDCTDLEGSIYGMDQFIGEVDYWNKGIGQLLVQSTIDHLTKVLKVDKVVMDPQAWNVRAISCYEKCGFEKVKLLPKHEWHEGEMRDCWLMVYSEKNIKND